MDKESKYVHNPAKWLTDDSKWHIKKALVSSFDGGFKVSSGKGKHSWNDADILPKNIYT